MAISDILAHMPNCVTTLPLILRYYNYYGEGNLDQDLADLHLHIQNDTFEIIYLYKTPLTEFQWTNLVFYHVYLIFYTSTREGGFWWSLEKNEECLLLQVSRDIDDVKDKREGVLRVSPKNSWYWEPQYIKRDSCWVKFEDLYRFLILDQDLSNIRYNFATENCKGFAKIIFDKTANNKRWHYVI